MLNPIPLQGLSPEKRSEKRLGSNAVVRIGLASLSDSIDRASISQDLGENDIGRAIIGSAKEAEKPIRPGEATGTALLRHLRGDTDDQREERYATTLRATPATLKETMLRVLETNEPHSAVCVVSSQEKLEEANRRLGEGALSISNILP